MIAKLIFPYMSLPYIHRVLYSAVPSDEQTCTEALYLVMIHLCHLTPNLSTTLVPVKNFIMFAQVNCDSWMSAFLFLLFQFSTLLLAPSKSVAMAQFLQAEQFTAVGCRYSGKYGSRVSPLFRRNK